MGINAEILVKMFPYWWIYGDSKHCIWWETLVFLHNEFIYGILILFEKFHRQMRLES